MKLRLKELEKYVPPDVLELMQSLKTQGYAAYLVGGCVRDLILGLAPSDWDVATSAQPDAVEALFPQTVAVGKHYGSIGVLGRARNDASREETLMGIEKNIQPVHQVTTFRCDRDYGDHRHPDQVVFASDISEDLARRDFTINAIAYDPIDKELIDLYQGIEDLKFEKLRTVGSARERFSEDSLRPFRAVRFVAQLGFSLDAATLSALAEVSRNLPLPSWERIGAEWQKLIKGKAFLDGLDVLMQSGLWGRIFETWSGDEALLWLKANQERLQNLPEAIRLAALLQTRTDAAEILRRLTYSKRDIAWTLKLIENELDEKKAAMEVQDLKLSAADLIGLGLRGEAIGRMQRSLLAFVKATPSKNRKSVLMEEAQRILTEGQLSPAV